MFPLVQLLNESAVKSEIWEIETILPLLLNIVSFLFHFEIALLCVTV